MSQKQSPVGHKDCLLMPEKIKCELSVQFDGYTKFMVEGTILLTIKSTGIFSLPSGSGSSAGKPPAYSIQQYST
jgi:hypothetical protein